MGADISVRSSGTQTYYLSIRAATYEVGNTTYYGFTGVSSSTKGTSTASYISLGELEQVVYMYNGVGSGSNSLRTYTGVLSAEYDTFVNACKTIVTGITVGGGFTQEDLDNAAQEGYDYGWEVGNSSGYTNGYTEGFQIGNQEGYDDGYNAGYDLGIIDGSPTVLDVPGIITAIPNGAREIINGALDFEVFGINVAGTLLAILVVAIVAFIVKKVK